MQPIVMTWPGGEHAFRLRLAEIEALQQATDMGPERLLNIIRYGDWLAAQLEHTVIQALIGGGMEKADAQKLVRSTIERGFGLVLFKPVAMMALQMALYAGPEDDPAGKSAAPAGEPGQDLP